MGNGNLYIGNINYKASAEDVNQLFGQYGNVINVKLIEKDGLKKGFGFVEFDSEESAKNAQNALNNQEFMGRNLRVDFARPKQNNYNKSKY
jgi:RNA recognition motif-containing protein